MIFASYMTLWVVVLLAEMGAGHRVINSGGRTFAVEASGVVGSLANDTGLDFNATQVYAHDEITLASENRTGHRLVQDMSNSSSPTDHATTQAEQHDTGHWLHLNMSSPLLLVHHDIIHTGQHDTKHQLGPNMSNLPLLVAGVLHSRYNISTMSSFMESGQRALSDLMFNGQEREYGVHLSLKSLICSSMVMFLGICFCSYCLAILQDDGAFEHSTDEWSTAAPGTFSNGRPMFGEAPAPWRNRFDGGRPILSAASGTIRNTFDGSRKGVTQARSEVQKQWRKVFTKYKAEGSESSQRSASRGNRLRNWVKSWARDASTDWQSDSETSDDRSHDRLHHASTDSQALGRVKWSKHGGKYG